MEFIGDIARKTGDPSLLAVEALKSEKAAEIGRDSGLFYVPKVLRFDEKNGQLDFERLHSLVTLAQLAIDGDPRLFSLLEKTGQALATIHERLVLPEQFRVDLPAEWMGPATENVFVHGDFTIGNIGVDDSSGRLVITDWSAAPLLGRRPTFGIRYFDVLWFASSMFCALPTKRVFIWPAERAVETFVRWYVECTAGKGLDGFWDYSREMHRLHKKNISRLARGKPVLKRIPYAFVQMLMYARLWAFCLYTHKQRNRRLLGCWK